MRAVYLCCKPACGRGFLLRRCCLPDDQKTERKYQYPMKFDATPQRGCVHSDLTP